MLEVKLCRFLTQFWSWQFSAPLFVGAWIPCWQMQCLGMGWCERSHEDGKLQKWLLELFSTVGSFSVISLLPLKCFFLLSVAIWTNTAFCGALSRTAVTHCLLCTDFRVWHSPDEKLEAHVTGSKCKPQHENRTRARGKSCQCDIGMKLLKLGFLGFFLVWKIKAVC